jgi:DNA-binding LacI/PurR family transcriptional regulator
MASIMDVAKLAEVSITTVSRVLGGSSHPVSAEKRKRVLEAVQALNYTPDAQTKAMVSSATNIIGVIIGDATDPYFATIVRGVEDVAHTHGYIVMVCNSDRIPAIELKYLTTLYSYRVDGLIFAGDGLLDEDYLRAVEHTLKLFQKRKAACVSLGKHLFSSLSIQVDNVQVIEDAMDYLISLGHTAIAYISGPSMTTAEDRLSGYKISLEKHGLKLHPRFVLPGNYKSEAGLRAARLIHHMSRKPTAILASNDIMAVGCLVELKELGYKIPEDFSVVGVGDIPFAKWVDPPLTTVSLPLYDLGKIGMERVIKLRYGEILSTDPIVLSHLLVVRKSTAQPKT